MNEGARSAPSAGALVRAAREQQGLHIAALAAAIKVAPRKLDALENDRWNELPDATFTRALAQTVCRTLKIDPRPVLDLLPPAEAVLLEEVGGHLNAPFRDRPEHGARGLAASAIRPMVWAGALLMVAAMVVYLAPENLWNAGPRAVAAAASMPAAAASTAIAATASGAQAAQGAAAQALLAAAAPLGAASAQAAEAPLPIIASATPGEAVAAAPPAAEAAATPAGRVRLHTRQASWIDVRDARGQVLLSRTVQPGESVGLDGALPIRLTIGNAAATQLGFRGQPVDLAPRTRDNVARVELR